MTCRATSEFKEMDGSGGRTRVSVTVTNTGDREGVEVVRLHLPAQPGGNGSGSRRSISHPEKASVTLAADPRLLAEYVVARRGWIIAPGNYQVAIGPDAGTMALAGSARLSGRTLKP
ncbi:MAG TPA: hypothetical protein VI168_08925 [Croceibacterium sp.]